MWSGIRGRLEAGAVLALAAAGLALMPMTARAQFAGEGRVPTLAPLVRRVAPAVVNISIEGHRAVANNPMLSDPFFRQFFGTPDNAPQTEQSFEAAGSGVIIDAAKGYVLTNAHVVAQADQITVTLADSREFKAKLIGTDPESDVAVLQIKPDKLTELPLGDSDALQVGDYVVAVGNPFGLGQTVTEGIVSALQRSGLGIEGYEDFIQTDAPINPGNSGGALVDLNGRLVGINTAIVGPSGGSVGIGFAIPVNMARSVMDQLIKTGEVKHGHLGVYVQDLTPDLASAVHVQPDHGVLVARVEDGSPAAKAGLKAGDVIQSVDGQDVHNSSDLRNKIGLRDPNDRVTLGVLRDQKTLTITTTLSAAAAEGPVPGDQIDSRLAGAAFGAVPQQGSSAAGVLVTQVDNGSSVFRDGLRKGDIITAVNGQEVTSVDEFEQVVKEVSGTLLFQVARGNAALFVAVK
jgi:Do/DeqQ family serine protease